MLFDTFMKIVSKFTDSPDDFEYEKGRLVLQIGTELIDCEIKPEEGRNVLIIDGGKTFKPDIWISRRLAKLPILADRILSFIPEEKYFVNITGSFTDNIIVSPDEISVDTPSVTEKLLEFADRKTAGESSIVYLTSDAGEGKTTVINYVARQQAKLYQDRKTDWLLLPISLGGRPFIRLDDVIVGTLSNKLRFSFMYYDSVIELVKLGYLVLALDGFEEMFVEGPAGEAISALGGLLNNLNSSGNILIAARKAYFEFKNLKTQGKLFDTFSSQSVSFSKISIDRWGEEQFVDYGIKRGINDANIFYKEYANILKSNHPLLTRAVLVKRLFDIVSSVEDRKTIIDKLHNRDENYFRAFIDVIIEREVSEKWIDKGGEVALPLLEKSEHYLLLSYIAEEMWRSSVSSLPGSILDLLSSLVCELLGKSPTVERQVKERIKQHALLIQSPTSRNDFEFDHEEFKQYFLSIRIQSLIKERQKESLKALFSQSTLPDFVLQILAPDLIKNEKEAREILQFIITIAQSANPISFLRENCGYLVIRLLDNLEHDEYLAQDLFFPVNSLDLKNIQYVEFFNCYFQATGTKSSHLHSCIFTKCSFERLEITNDRDIKDVTFKDSCVSCLYLEENDHSYYDPEKINSVLSSLGIKVLRNTHEVPNKPIEFFVDEELSLTKRAFRSFLRATQINENFFRVKLGSEANKFFENIVPELIKSGIMAEIGSGKQKRYKLSVKMTDFEKACAQADGNFGKFIEYFA